MPVVTIFGTSTDGCIQSTSASYAAAREGIDGIVAIPDFLVVGQTTTFDCYESFVKFDTSSIPDGANITTVVFSLFGKDDSSTTDFTVKVALRDWGTTLETGDFVAGSSLGALTDVASRHTSLLTVEAYNDFNNLAFPANINRTGETRVIVFSDSQEFNVTPTTLERYEFYSESNTGTSKDPKLTITYTDPAYTPRHSAARTRA